MTVLRVDSSIQGDRSASSALADLVLREFTTVRPEVPVVRRHLGQDPLPADAWATAVAGGFTPENERTPGQREALATAALVAAIPVPVVAEGRFDTPDLVAEAFKRGAHAVVVGTAITNPREITRKFVRAAS